MANSSKIKLPPLNVIPTITSFKKNLLLLDSSFKFLFGGRLSFLPVANAVNVLQAPIYKSVKQTCF